METIVPSPSPLVGRDVLQPMLSPREELIWTGKPPQGLYFPDRTVAGGVFSLIWALGVLFIFGLPILQGNLTAVSGFGWIFITVALYNLLGKFFINLYQRRQTLYGITNRRIIIHKGGIGGGTTSFDLKTLQNLQLDVERGGRGSIILGAPTTDARNQPKAPTLEGIPDAQQVYDLIQDIRIG